MEREELFENVKDVLGDTQLTLSERTINEELDDVLADFGDDDEANKALVVKVANRLKRMDGNLHADVSEQVKAYKKKASAKKVKPTTQPEPTPDDDDDTPAWAKKLTERLDAMESERKAERAKQEKAALVKFVKDGLTAKFKDAGMDVNEFFLGTALSKLQIPEEGANTQALTGELEKLYNADMKAAGIEQGFPHLGGGGNKGGSNKSVEDYFARKAKKEGWKKD